MFPFLGSLIGAGASLLGGLFGQKNQQDINAQNIAEQDKINAQNIALQKEFAQNGIQWKVEDAKAAGINPLAALGASTSSFSNVVGSTAQADNSFGKGVAAAGQDIGRALRDSMTAGDKHAQTMAQLQEVHGELENQLLASQIAKYHNAGAGGPPTPAAGQQWVVAPGVGPVDPASASTSPVKLEAQKVGPSMPDSGDMPAVNPSGQWFKLGNGWVRGMSPQFAGATSNDTLMNLIFRGNEMLAQSEPPSWSPGEGRAWRNYGGVWVTVKKGAPLFPIFEGGH